MASKGRKLKIRVKNEKTAMSESEFKRFVLKSVRNFSNASTSHNSQVDALESPARPAEQTKPTEIFDSARGFSVENIAKTPTSKNEAVEQNLVVDTCSDKR